MCHQFGSFPVLIFRISVVHIRCRMGHMNLYTEAKLSFASLAIQQLWDESTMTLKD